MIIQFLTLDQGIFELEYETRRSFMRNQVNLELSYNRSDYVVFSHVRSING